MRQRALVTVLAAVVLACLGLIAPVAGSERASGRPDVVDAELSGLPTATDADGEPVVDEPDASGGRGGARTAQSTGDGGAHAHDGHAHYDDRFPVGAAGGVRSEPVETPIAFSLAALEVPEGVGVSLRTRSEGGAWGEWHDVRVVPDEGPDASSGEGASAAAAAPGRWFSEPVWVGEADELQLRVDGAAPEDVGVHLVDSLGQNRGAGERVADAARAVAEALTTGGRPAAAVIDRPEIITRSEWGADESKRSGSPSYTDHVDAAVLHHTATGNDYSRSEAASVIRSIYHYHAQTRGWTDIGYNFLVDRFGRLYQGRAGGLEEPVVGAHAAGYNAETVGVAFVGTHAKPGGVSLPEEAEASATRLLQWLFDVHHIDGEADAWLGGNRVPPIIGHGDVGSTDCPGGYVRDRMDAVRGDVADGQAEMFTAPRESATQLGVGDELRVSAGLKPPGEWELTVRHEDAGVLHGRQGRGEEASIAWEAPRAGMYEWTLSSPGRRPASGEVSVMDEVAGKLESHGPMEGTVELSRLAFPETATADPPDTATASHAVIARADVFADAMAGGPLAGSEGPLLLTPSNRLDEDVARELVRVLPDGETVYVLGGEAAIEEAVVDDLELRWEVERLAGAERTETAALVAEEVLERSGEDRALLARSAPDSANPWADALAASGWGAREGVPVVLTPTHTLTGAAEEALARVSETIVLGGPAAISDHVLGRVPSPRRVAGGDRSATAVAIARQLWGRTAGEDGDAFLVGAGWSDLAWQRALASAPLAAKEDAPLLLTAGGSVSSATAAYLEELGYGDGAAARGWVLEHEPVIETATWTELNLLMQ